MAVFLLTINGNTAFAQDGKLTETALVNSGITKINASVESGTSLHLTDEEAYALLAYGGEEGMEAIQKVILPVVEPESPAGTSVSKPSRERYSYLYDPDTGELTYVDGNRFYEPAPERNSAESVTPLDAYPTDWYTTNPEEYSDTRSTCKLIMYSSALGSYFGGSGWLLTSNDVVTAGHCLYNEMLFGGDSWATYIKIIPSYSEANPNGAYGSLYSYLELDSIEIGGGWIDGGIRSDDWAVMSLDGNYPASAGHYTPVVAGEIDGWARIEGYNSDDSLQQDLRNIGGPIVGIGIIGQAEGIMSFEGQVHNGMSGGPCMESGQYVMGIAKGTGIHGEILKIDDWLCNKLLSYQ